MDHKYSNMFKYGIIILLLTVAVQCKLRLILLHTNDIHGRYEEIEKDGTPCQPEHRNKSCIGGFARMAHLIRKYRKEAEDGVGPPVIFLNAGDVFIGTRWDSIHKWKIAAEFMNVVKPDVQCLGDHDFDRGIGELSKFVKACKFPTIGGNVNFKNELSLRRIKKSKILTIKGMRIGVVGHVTKETAKTSFIGKTIFSDEIKEVKKETKRLTSLENKIKIIIVLGHSGYEKDKAIAKKVPLVDVVVGGHSHTFLWPDMSNKPPNYITETPSGAYPTSIIVNDTSHCCGTMKAIPVVQTYGYNKYLGKLELTFDDEGNLYRFKGTPIYLDSSIPQENDVLNLLEVYRPAIDKLDTKIVGTTMVDLTLAENICRSRECNYGNLIADAYVLYNALIYPKYWTDAPIGLMNAGSIKNSEGNVLKLGNNRTVTKGAIVDTLPIGYQIVSLKLKGSDLVKTLELGIRGNETSRGGFLQVSGLQVVYDESKPPMSRVVSVKTRCGSSCLNGVPTYSDIDPDNNYSIVTTDYLAHGFDGHYILKEKGFDKKHEHISDMDTVIWYFETFGPAHAEVQGRIKFAYQIREYVSNSVLYRPTEFTILVLIAYLTL